MMLSLIQAIILGGLQGLTELFPISSLGHTVILPSLLGWNIDQSNPLFLSFVIATHLATALVLFGFFWSDWVKIIKGFFRSLFSFTISAGDTYAKVAWLLVIGTIPAGFIGLVFQTKLQTLFASPRIAALFLLLNGFLLFGAELLRRRRINHTTQSDSAIAHLTWMQSFKVGIMQCLALIPGFSRTGSTLAGGLLEGLSHENAARFSFLLATPILFAAAILKLPKVLVTATSGSLSILAVGALCAALAAYLSVRFLSRYFKTKTLVPFALYCVVAGSFALLILR